MSQAVTWAKAQTVGDRSTKAVLVSIASYAGPDNEAWCQISTIVLETELSERMVQYAVRKLKTLGYLEETGRFHRKANGQRVPLYRLPDYEGNEFLMPKPPSSLSVGTFVPSF